MFESCGYKWKFVRVVDKRTGAKTTTVCMVKPVNQDIGWARAGVAVFSPNREVVKEFDNLGTYDAKRNAVKANNPKTNPDSIRVFVTHTDKFRKDVGRLIALNNAVNNLNLNPELSEGVLTDFDESDYGIADYMDLSTPEWQWLDNYL